MAANRGQSEPGPVPDAGGGKKDHGGAPPVPPRRHPLPVPPPPPPSPQWHPSGPGPAVAGGGAPAPPAPRPPSPGNALLASAHQPQLPAPCALTYRAVIESGRRTSLKALGLVRKTLSRPDQKRILPEHHAITISTKKKESKEQNAELLKPWRSTPIENEATTQVSPSGAENDKNHAIATKKKESKEQSAELLKPWRSTPIGKEARTEVSPSGAENVKNHAIATKMVDCGCIPIATCTKVACATGNQSTVWGRNFELKFGNKTASKHSAEATISGSGGGDNTVTKHQNKATEDFITVVVSSIHDLLAFDPETSIVEFDSNIEGKELGRLFRIARVLKFKRFVRSDTFVRAQLHYICNSYDGERRGRNLDAEAKEVLCSNKDKEK